jgi:putative transcriptional regulator
MIRLHPSDDILIAAAGSLPEPHRRVLAAHLSLCRTCRERHRDLHEVGGGLLDTIVPSLLADDALARVLAKVNDATLRQEPAAPDTRVTLASIASGRWRWTGPGVAMMSLLRRDETDSRLDLIRVAPGVGLLEHGHTGIETTVVLQGTFDDGHMSYSVGDFSEVDADFDHRPRALGEQDCICLIATTGHLSARGWLGRLVRPLIGM